MKTCGCGKGPRILTQGSHCVGLRASGDCGDFEAPAVATLYLNRLNKGMALQADPPSFCPRRPFHSSVLDVHKGRLSVQHYQHRGLPPADSYGTHATCKRLATRTRLFVHVPNREEMAPLILRNYREHLRNARAYQSWLNKQRIYR